MGIGKHFNFGKAAKVIKAGQKDVAKPKATVSDLNAKRQQKNGGGKSK